ncbi:MAG: ABC transporter substrate-binding protein [Bacteroidetes bacterium]|nr:ABC transporter substrate-binding protein [Bacteroidota bacterium]
MKYFFSVWIPALAVLVSCGSPPRQDTIVVGVKADPDQINPVTHFSAFGRILCTGVFPRLLESHFDTTDGVIKYSPLLARRYEYSEDRKSLTYYLRSDMVWEDGHPVTAQDVQFTFGLIANPVVTSSKKEHLALLDFGDPPDIFHAVEVIDDSTVTFHFLKSYPLQIYDSNLQPGFLPFHLLKNVDPATLKTDPFNAKPLSGGPYRIERWKHQEELILSANQKYVPGVPSTSTIFFRVIPEYVTRLSALKSGEIDIMYPVNPQDASLLLQTNPEIRIEVMRGRYYDYIGWQNIDQKAYHTSGGKIIRPHPLFGNRIVRRALTLAINRAEILQGFLGDFGQQAFGPISPVFKWAYNDTLKPYAYDPQAARELLEGEGWRDHDGDGIIDRDGLPFAFDLHYDAGNDRREFAALLIQKYLSAIGIQVTIDAAETNVFYDNELNKQYDAFISGIGVTLMIDPTSEWNSDLEKNRYNDVSYQNPTVDRLIEEGKSVKEVVDAASCWREFQVILHNDEPATFLYWRDEIVAYRSSIKNTSTGILGEIDKFWLWQKVR